MAHELALYQLVDSAFPTGAFAHSFGLETAYQEGRIIDPEDLFNWIRSYISGKLAPMEGRSVFIAYHTLINSHEDFRHLPDETSKQLQLLDQKLTLSSLPAESRAGSSKIGNQYLTIGKQLYPNAGLAQYKAWVEQNLCYGHSAVAHGWIAAYLGVSADTAINTHLYTAVNNLLQSALRLTIAGQTAIQMILQQCLETIQTETKKIIAQNPGTDDLFSFSLIQDIAAMRHEQLYSRLFMS